MQEIRNINLEYQKVVYFPLNDRRENVTMVADFSQFTLNSIKLSGRLLQNLKGKKKPCGQDCLSVSVNKGFLVAIVCDGHGKNGFEFASNVCELLPKMILSSSISKLFDDDFLTRLFEDCSRLLSIPDDPVGLEGTMEDGNPCIIESIQGNKYRVEWYDAFNQIKRYDDIRKEKLYVSGFIGGTTCTCIIINIQEKTMKTLNCGDSRILIIPPKVCPKYRNHSSFNKINSVDLDLKNQNLLGTIYYTKYHTLQSIEERDRIVKETNDSVSVYPYGGQHYLESALEDHLEPTRGIGDYHFESQGYSHKPEISPMLKVHPGTIICLGTDGVFFQFPEERGDCFDTLQVFGNEVVDYYAHNDFELLSTNCFEGIVEVIYDKLGRENPQHDDINSITLLNITIISS
eukprot:snap_masked-scaffold_2-processed-gene-24.27-mRNA-1 protein AED:0.08 eAED:0.08 QI:356/0.57/0.62/1/0.85/0.75/8/157/401